MTDIESMLAQVWDSGTRSLAEEAWRCYNAGAIRASIAATWTAVTADIIAKFGHLADDGEPRARIVRDEVEGAQLQGLRKEGVRAMQNIEAALLATALDLEIIDAIDERALERIREDRNLCVHPSLRPFNETYMPAAEVARAHLAVALETLFVHRPTQGRKIVESYSNFTCARGFTPAVNHIQSAYFDRVRDATRRSIVAIAAKHALLEIDPDGRAEPKLYADRSAVVLSAFAMRDRQLVRGAVVGLQDRFRHSSPFKQRRALGRLGHEDFFWDMTDTALIEHLNALVGEPIPADSAISEVEATVLSTVAIESARSRLPALTAQFAALLPSQQAAVIDVRPDPYFVPAVIALVAGARNYRTGDRVGQLMVKMSPFLSLQDLDAALEGWAANDQCRMASEMPGAAVSVYLATTHLGPRREAAFRRFLERVRSYSDENDGFYWYPALEDVLPRVQPES